MGYIDAVEATPEVYTLLFENEAVRVIEMRRSISSQAAR